MEQTTTENTKKSKLELRKRFNDTFASMFPLAMIFLALLIFTRVYEIIGVGVKPGGFIFEVRGLLYDLLLVMAFSAILIIPYFVLYVIYPKVAKWFYVVLMIVVLVGNYMLVGYFIQSKAMLGEDLFSYSREDMSHTVGASGAVNILTILPIILLIGLAIFLPMKIKRLKVPILVSTLFFVLSIVLLFFIELLVDRSTYKEDIFANYENNKFSYFFGAAYKHYFPDMTDNLYNEFYYTDNEDANADGGKDFQLNYVSDDYPFLHTEQDRDVLGSFFNIGTERPNLVFIVEESLGRSYSGPDALQGSFTPYLDSLMDHSIYFDNFLSSAGRTFGMMPSIYASAPFGNAGFLDLGDKMPTHASIISILRQNGYFASFYYGGDAHFDNMDIFLHKNNVDRIVQEKDYGPGYTKLPANSGGFTWGYGDKELFRKMLEVNKTPVNKPRLDMFMTVANHSPFMVQNQNYYMNLFESRLKTLPFDAATKDDFRKNAKYYSTVLYADDAIRQFINAYKSRPDYENTIFIITGDHRMPEIPIITKIDRYHVPFIIFSPMLKRTERIKSVSTHLDITPTFLAFLQHNYGITLPKYSSWVSPGIDTFEGFRNVHSVALMPVKGTLADYLDKDYFIDNGTLFKISDKLNIDPYTDEQKQKEIESKFTDYKEKNKKATLNNKLYPDSLMKINIVAAPVAEPKKAKKK